MAHQANGHNYQFYGVGRKKASRRANVPKGNRADRKMYAYTTAVQVGTPMEGFINGNYDGLDEQFNGMSGAARKNLQMQLAQAVGSLKTDWGKASLKMQSPKRIHDMMKKRRVSMTKARKNAVVDCIVHFGADPRSR